MSEASVAGTAMQDFCGVHRGISGNDVMIRSDITC